MQPRRVVYLDVNENGRYDAGETAAANVTVILEVIESRRESTQANIGAQRMK